MAASRSLFLPLLYWWLISDGFCCSNHCWSTSPAVKRFLSVEIERGLTSPLSLTRLNPGVPPAISVTPSSQRLLSLCEFLSPLFLGYVPWGSISGEQTNFGPKPGWLLCHCRDSLLVLRDADHHGYLGCPKYVKVLLVSCPINTEWTQTDLKYCVFCCEPLHLPLLQNNTIH